MKEIMMSIKGNWITSIFKRNKIIEVRKSRPKEKGPFKIYIYCTKGSELYRIIGNDIYNTIPVNGKVVGEFICDEIEEYKYEYCDIYNEKFYHISLNTCANCYLSFKDIQEYGNGKNIYLWHISNLKIYDQAKELKEFNMKRPPQSWCYVNTFSYPKK